jgi:hypothetical protein
LCCLRNDIAESREAAAGAGDGRLSKVKSPQCVSFHTLTFQMYPYHNMLLPSLSSNKQRSKQQELPKKDKAFYYCVADAKITIFSVISVACLRNK